MVPVNGSGEKWRLVLLGAFLICGLILEFGQCQQDEQEGRTTPPDRKPKSSKGKPVRGAGKATTKPKPRAKATPAPPSAVNQGPVHLTQVVNKGKFRRVADSLSIRSGDTLELRCKGNPVEWGVPVYLEEDDEGRLRTVQHDRYGTLTLSNSTGADTGEYTCFPMYCEDRDCRKVYDKAVKVFVFFPDPQELFVPSSSYYEVIQLRTNWPTVLPCQVTSPDAKVSLHREFPPGEVAVDGAEITFNVKQGFTIHRPKLHHAGELYCVASLGNLRQSSVKYMLIYVNYPVAPPTPVIQASSNSVAIGQNLQVTCTVIGEQDVVIDFTWEYPGQQIGRPLYTQDSVHPDGGGLGRQQSQTVLLVDEVREVDGGTYTCTAQNLQGSRTTSTTIKVLAAAAKDKVKDKPKPKKP
ncbi:platelet-derived growth factor receptor-like protein [Oncorhynchus kisutch]|uniref:Platelet-derived growth factor receptor-like protein n=1 Tax=Oncorhynchus kisutch TaxID=8019 RepID=A0A8C7MGX5_ONCKI|nr:platelet-derived growth factor receptor-like protein [Oncorhynchus kisutch]